MTGQRAVVEKHQRAAAAAIKIALLPARAILTRFGSPDFESELAGYGALGLLREAPRANTTLPSLIAAKRQTYGLATVEVALNERRANLDQERALTDAICASPHLTDLAVQLLDGIAKAANNGGAGQ